jgi:hypothetical protein
MILTPLRLVVNLFWRILEWVGKSPRMSKWLGLDPEVMGQLKQAREWMNETLTYTGLSGVELTKGAKQAGATVTAAAEAVKNTNRETKKNVGGMLDGLDKFLKSLGAVTGAVTPEVPKPATVSGAPASPELAPMFGRGPIQTTPSGPLAGTAEGGGQKVEITNKLYIDGNELAIALGRRRIDYLERQGFRLSAEQRRSLLEMGAY